MSAKQIELGRQKEGGGATGAHPVSRRGGRRGAVTCRAIHRAGTVVEIPTAARARQTAAAGCTVSSSMVLRTAGAGAPPFVSFTAVSSS